MSGVTNTAEYRRTYYKKRRDEVIEQLGGKCAKCGSTLNLEIDHIDPFSKSFSVSTKLMHMSRDRINAELSKCQLLCRTCHETKSRVDLSKKASGPNNSYYRKTGIEFPTSKQIISLDDGLKFESIRDAAKYYGINESHVADVVRGTRPHTHNRHFRRLDMHEVMRALRDKEFVKL